MDTARWQRIREIFDEVVELDAEQRAIVLDRHCSKDDALRAEIESLLQHDSDDASLDEAIGAGAD